MDATDVGDLRDRVGRLEDVEEIRALVGRYGRAVDDRDWESLAAQYTPDAFIDFTAGRARGRAAIIDHVRSRTAAYAASYHYPHSHEITLTGRDTATGLVCAHAELTIEGDSVRVALRYHDDYRRVDGRWRFHERRMTVLYVLPLRELSSGFARRDRIRWPGTEPAPAQVGADVAAGRTPDPR